MKTRKIMACCISAALLFSACGSTGGDSQTAGGQSAAGASQAANVTSAGTSSSGSGSGAGEDGEGWQDFTAVGDYGGKITETYIYTILPASDDTSGDAYAYDEYNKLRVLRWNVTIENAGVKTEISLEADENTRFYPDASEVTVEQDVNFDGRMDVMLCKGSVGSGDDPIYDCYVAMEDGTFKKVEGFDEILKPVFDTQEKLITSNVDESDTSSYLERYRVDGVTLEKLDSIHYVYDKQNKEWVEAQ